MQQKHSTVDIIRFLPLDQSVKDRLLEIYPEKVSYEEGVQIEDLVWDLYYAYFDTLYAHHIELECIEAKGAPPDGYQERAMKKTQEEMSRQFESKYTGTEIEKLRYQLSQLAQASTK